MAFQQPVGCFKTMNMSQAQFLSDLQPCAERRVPRADSCSDESFCNRRHVFGVFR
jgi:hypothetical protein